MARKTAAEAEPDTATPDVSSDLFPVLWRIVGCLERIERLLREQQQTAQSDAERQRRIPRWSQP